MKYGMTVDQYKILDSLVIRPLRQQGAQIYIFGSRVSEKYHPHSDVDLLYRLPVEKDLPAGFISQLKENIEESKFPFLVDLVDEDDLASSYRENVFQSMQKLE